MKVAFVGVKRKYLELQPEYRLFFTRFHLELPYYFARDGRMYVTVTTVDGHSDAELFDEDGREVSFLAHTPEGDLGKGYDHTTDSMRPGYEYDVVVHWRKWFPEFYRPEAINVINCQDHSFGQEWQESAQRAFQEKKLYGILCFPTWHKRNLLRECPWLPEDRAIDGLTLGVDTDIYKPMEDKDPYQMLWASDPGRGLNRAIQLAVELFQVDRRFRLHVCYPDYCRNVQRVNHPALVWHGNVNNGPHLWRLFNECGMLPYTSNFLEPSSRAHRQAMAAGSLVCYPPGMGTPSELIESGRTGFVQPVDTWTRTIVSAVDTGMWKDIGRDAREYAISENWETQAKRFREYFEKVIGGDRK